MLARLWSDNGLLLSHQSLIGAFFSKKQKKNKKTERLQKQVLCFKFLKQLAGYFSMHNKSNHNKNKTFLFQSVTLWLCQSQWKTPIDTRNTTDSFLIRTWCKAEIVDTRKNFYSYLRSKHIGSVEIKLLQLSIMPPWVGASECAWLGISVCNGVLRIVGISDVERYGARGKHQAADCRI